MTENKNMTEKEFVIWLHGFFKISNAKTLDENQVAIIKDHLALFFKKETPDRLPVSEDFIKRLFEKQNPVRWPINDDHVNIPPSIPSYPIPPYTVTCDQLVDKSNQTHC